MIQFGSFVIGLVGIMLTVSKNNKK
ncbi:putative holin-like toxin [Enterococcus villorum]|nr:putative holin-like toxin [Enterococcus villorum]